MRHAPSCSRLQGFYVKDVVIKFLGILVVFIFQSVEIAQVYDGKD